MSGINWAVYRLNIDICTKLNKINESLWDLKYYIALKELKYAIYDGLEMRLKVTRMSIWNKVFPLWCIWWCKMNCPCVMCPVSSWFLTDGPERSPNVTFTALLCILLFFTSSEWSWKKSISQNMMINPEMVLKGVQNTLYIYGWS